MIISVYLHKEIAETLKCYGELSEVVNRVLDVSEEGIFDLMDMPKCSPRDGAIRYNIDVTNEYYLTLMDTYSPTSPRISLRRVLYWFVEQEMPSVLGWEAVNEYVDRDKVKILKKLGGVESELVRLHRLLTDSEKEYCKQMLSISKKLKEVIENGR